MADARASHFRAPAAGAGAAPPRPACQNISGCVRLRTFAIEQ